MEKCCQLTLDAVSNMMLERIQTLKSKHQYQCAHVLRVMLEDIDFSLNQYMDILD